MGRVCGSAIVLAQTCHQPPDRSYVPASQATHAERQRLPHAKFEFCKHNKTRNRCVVIQKDLLPLISTDSLKLREEHPSPLGQAIPENHQGFAQSKLRCAQPFARTWMCSLALCEVPLSHTEVRVQLAFGLKHLPVTVAPACEIPHLLHTHIQSHQRHASAPDSARLDGGGDKMSVAPLFFIIVAFLLRAVELRVIIPSLQ
jgi:hypothetical protein